jgi:beta-galactosidase
VAQDGSWGSGFSTVIDVQGINYVNHGNIDTFHTSFPNQPLMGTEEGSAYYTRGIYTNTTTYKSAYDLNKPGYGTTAEQWWQYYVARTWAAGSCNWTGFDYRGEPAPFTWPNISSLFGAVDTCGFAKDVYYYYQANWSGKPVLHILPHWNWPTPGQVINVWTFSSCNQVELFLNGTSQGRQSNNPMSHLEWNIPYAAGTLQAIGYVNGQAVITNTVATTGTPVRISLQPDRQTILADGRDVSMVTVSVVDSQGRVVPTAANTVNFTITGGTIIGLGNGDPIDHESDKATNNIGLRSVFNGLAQVIVQSTNSAGTITLTATATGLTSTNVSINEVVNAPAPDGPAGPVAIGSGGQVWLSWDVVPGAVTYNLKRTLVSGEGYITIISNTSSLSHIDTDVVNGTTYYYVLSAVNANGESTNSVEVSAMPQLAPPLFVVQPNSFTNARPIYAGVPVTFYAQVNGGRPIYYQWYQIPIFRQAATPTE